MQETTPNNPQDTVKDTLFLLITDGRLARAHAFAFLRLAAMEDPFPEPSFLSLNDKEREALLPIFEHLHKTLEEEPLSLVLPISESESDPERATMDIVHWLSALLEALSLEEARSGFVPSKESLEMKADMEMLLPMLKDGFHWEGEDALSVYHELLEAVKGFGLNLFFDIHSFHLARPKKG